MTIDVGLTSLCKYLHCDALHVSFSFEPIELEPDKWGAMMLWTDLQILYHQHW